uniref:MICOS complex subunit MIC13 n=1 Tax=Wuchereria bancrofti TaxID=6293 RepID=A0AAF5PU02_WUCBA
MTIFRRLIRTGIKISAVVAALKVSYHFDIWSLDSNQGAQKLTVLKETIIPGTTVFPKEILPWVENYSRFSAKWNSALDKAFSLVRWADS